LDDGSLISVYYQQYADDGYTSILYTNWHLERIIAETTKDSRKNGCLLLLFWFWKEKRSFILL